MDTGITAQLSTQRLQLISAHGYCDTLQSVKEPNEQWAVEILRAARYTVEYYPARRNAWCVQFELSEGQADLLRLALKRCFWASRELSKAQPGEPLWDARRAGVEAMKQLDL